MIKETYKYWIDNKWLETDFYGFDRKILHRLDGPSLEHYEYGKLTDQIYYKNGKKHREDGPAWLQYTKDGSIFSEYFLNDLVYYKEEWEFLVKVKWTIEFDWTLDQQLIFTTIKNN